VVLEAFAHSAEIHTALVPEFDLPASSGVDCIMGKGFQGHRNQVVSLDQPSISKHPQEGSGMDQSSNDISTPVAGQFALPLRATFGLGDRVRKKSGAAWQGQVVGWYCTKLTPEGYAVESESHPGSVQIYPVAALERMA
jgi:dihydrofolate reductase (trimethoprim resistance protein)